MKNNQKKAVVVVGTAWGDEGKGKITDYLAKKADIIVRFQGGDNAGHSIEFNGKRYSLHIVPSGVFNSNIMNILGNGVVFNPKSFINEIAMLKKEGFECKNILISDRAHVIFDYHRELDGLYEQSLGNSKIGTTKKGIGPTYTDKISRRGIRVGDFVSKDFEKIYREKLNQKNNEILRLNGTPINVDESVAEYKKLAKKIKPYVADTIYYLNEQYLNGKQILFEGAQGAMLDIDFGTYPYVTSSNTTGTGACNGSGLGPTKIGEVVGIVKAYSTRVGEGPFPTEFNNKLSRDIRERAHEYGVTTKRPRRIGWLDAVVLKYSAMISGLTGLSIMLLDILSGIKEIKICTSYKLNGKTITELPSRIEDWEKCKPNYITMPGWEEDISKCTTYKSLPENAKKYLNKISELIGVDVKIVSVGPDRKQTIILKDIM
ncbi:MAG: adenylosuccinate synthase [Clostridia bacterium]|nr:adenylosuccinate synthase [Clostridia bacterium]